MVEADTAGSARLIAQWGRPEEAAIVLVGDAATIEGPVRDAGLGEVTILREEAPAEGEG